MIAEMKSAKVLDLIVNTVQELSLARDMDTVTRIVRTAARQITGADGATFVLRDGDHCYYADEDAISPLWKGSRFPMQTCISGWAMLNKRSVVIEDIYQDDRIPHDAYRPTFVRSLAMVPIRTISPIGAIGNYWAQLYRPTEEQLKSLQALADITAVTIENVNVYAQLEQRVRERTAQLEVANKELEAFSYSVSHDLRSPLRSILMYADMIEQDRDNQLSESSVRAISSMARNARKMNTLIDDLLNFSVLGKKSLAKSLVNSQAVVQKVVDDLKQSTGTNAAFEISSLPDVMADESLMEQVWVNLISNAIKYSSKKAHPLIRISARSENNEIVFRIDDNGAGFDMRYADKLFGTFQRLHNMSEFSGSGIGLALVHRIITNHNGRIWAEAKVNEGATFFFSLPRSLE